MADFITQDFTAWLGCADHLGLPDQELCWDLRI